jgi:hypothetical protein
VSGKPLPVSGLPVTECPATGAGPRAAAGPINFMLIELQPCKYISAVAFKLKLCNHLTGPHICTGACKES